MLVNQKSVRTVSDPTSPENAHEGAPIPAVLLVVCGVLIPVLISYAMGTTNEMQVIAAIIGILFMVLIAAVPAWGVIVFTGLLYIRPEESIPDLAGMHLTLIVGIVSALGMALRLALDKQPWVSTPMLGMMVGFVIAGVVSGSLGGLTSQAAMDFARFLMVVILLLNLLRTQKNYDRFVTSLVIFTTYLAIYSTYLLYSGVGTMDHGFARSKGTGIFSDPNDLAATLIAGMVLAMTRVMTDRGVKRFAYLLATLLLLYAIVQTGSRSGLIGVIVILVGGAALLSKKKLLIIGLAIGVFGAVLFAAPQRMTNFDTQEESANSRFVFWNEGIIQLRNNPIIGVGYLKFADVNNGLVAHNSFVTCFSELGLPGYFFWVGCIYFAYRRRPGMEADRSSRAGLELIGARLALTGYLVACFFITRTYSPITYIVITLPVAQQIASTEQTALRFYPPGETAAVWSRIGFICLGSILGIWIVAMLLR